MPATPDGDLPAATERLRGKLILFFSVFWAGVLLAVVGGIVDSLILLFVAIGVAALSGLLLVAVRFQMRSSPEAAAALRRRSKSGGLDQVISPWYVVDQPDGRFSARARRLGGPWYAVEVLDTTSGELLPLVASSPLTGQRSVERAIRYGIRGFYRAHPDEHNPQDAA